MVISFLEYVLFRGRVIVLAALGAVTLIMGYYASFLQMDAGFYKQLPNRHEYIKTFFEYQDRLFGANRIIIVLRQKEGDIWNQEFLTTLKNVTDDIFYLPGVRRGTVTSLWTPNTRILEITEDGITARDVIPGTITPPTMKGPAIEQLRNDVIKGGLVGRLVSNDFTASMVVAELLELDARTGERLNYFDLGEKLEADIRGKFEKEGGPHEIHIIGFAKMITDIANGGIESVPIFFGVAFILTVFSVYLYCLSWKLTWLTVGCSLASVVWQFGLLTFFGFGLDPLAILVPFLVFAIGTSHGIQQLNMVTAELAHGSSGEKAARSSFRGLLVPGSLSLITDAVGFAALIIVPIAQIQELAITASIGVMLKIISNLVMMPLIISFFTFSESYPARIERARNFRLRIIGLLGVFGRPSVAFPTFAIFVGLFVYSVIASLDRHIGDLHPGAPELLPDARYNYDSRIVADKFSIGLDLLTVVNATPPQACITYEHMKYLNDFTWYMENVPGVRSVVSAAYLAKQINAGWNEGNLKFRALPRNSDALSQAIGPIPTSSGLLDYSCEMLPVQVYLVDSKATTIKAAVDAIKRWREERGIPLALSQAGQPKLGLGGTTEDICWSERDGRNGSWTLEPGDLRNLTFAGQPVGEASYALTISGLRAPRETESLASRVSVFWGLEAPICPVTIAGTPVGEKGVEELWSVPLTLDVDPAVAQQPLPVLEVIEAAGHSLDGVTEVRIEGLPQSFHIRLASGNSGVAAAVNETIHASELPSILIVYAIIIFLTYITYFDWRAALGCCLPLTFATFFGYYFMLQLEIGLKVATLPVIVLVVGIGIDYAYYIYNRLQYHLSEGLDITKSYQNTVLETGNGVFFTAVNFAIGVSTWSFSPLKFQADMGLLLTFMFMTNMVMALTALPALAVVLDTLIPRKSLPYPGPEPGGHWQ
ncbi:MAG: MMPL family transporter [Alphaproteobacteria bacterium]|nr:MMPL family transporter [Alphaproteobacteria bacterium]